ncbi:XRE family transcriptional regulator [Nocardioides sp. Root122]|uniref:helix-turn-helix transcriptional regulator n=1 Tax=Nocardioides TaxID=1839 RepID=UPI000703497A|nr:MULTISPECIES: helix-turn-helix transcriptional regulator [Nocardioides]KQV71281.1 XRE family transcriptional regulator [Nocardioides sp. Root122]MCK9822767.1 helix-turn-helix transcriptional regulator [Nocardioides cavernae]
MDKDELAGFLRSRRERVTPADVGLPAGTRRRTPGLRREEVAQLAFISTEYYTRLEQGRAPWPSREVLAGLTRALRLDDAERDHLHRLAGSPVAERPGPSRQVRASVLELIDRVPHAAALVTSATFEVIAWNPLAAALMEDFSARSREDRNLARRLFLGPHEHGQRLYGVSDLEEFGRYAAARLRVALGRYPQDPELVGLVADLQQGSEEFARLWELHDVTALPALVKTFDHRVVGPVTVACDTFDITERGQQLVLYTAERGSPDEASLKLLSVIGTQRMDGAR